MDTVNKKKRDSRYRYIYDYIRSPKMLEILCLNTLVNLQQFNVEDQSGHWWN